MTKLLGALQAPRLPAALLNAGLTSFGSTDVEMGSAVQEEQEPCSPPAQSAVPEAVRLLLAQIKTS